MNLGTSISSVAKRLGVDPVDLATVISYETAGTFDPWKKGPVTKWGEHRGLIQWGKPQREQYGVTKDTSPAAQMDAVGKYLIDRGVKPGMGITDIYSAINAGGVGLEDRTDAHAGGAPGTVADKVATMFPHKLKAMNLLGMTSNPMDLTGMTLASTPAMPAPGSSVGAIAKAELNDPTKAVNAVSFADRAKGILANDKGMAALSSMAGAIGGGGEAAPPQIQQTSIGADGQQAAISQGAAAIMANLLNQRRARGMSLGGMGA